MVSYYDQRHLYHMHNYIESKLGWRRREEIQSWDIDKTFREFRRLYHNEDKPMTMTEKKKAIWRR
ncbi:hypothetical protein EYB35_07300 [Bacillus paranthracis]|nr:hypothetical protein EYB35_07300 [Bacillus paranthracis]